MEDVKLGTAQQCPKCGDWNVAGLKLPEECRMTCLTNKTYSERIKELEAWIVDCRDTLLYPLAFENSANGRLAEGFGASSVKLLSA